MELRGNWLEGKYPGEQGGFLHRVLQELVDMDEKRERLHSTLVSALTYRVVSGFLNSFGVELDDGVPGWPGESA